MPKKLHKTIVLFLAPRLHKGFTSIGGIPAYTDMERGALRNVVIQNCFMPEQTHN
jgi:hypothetical protein